MATPAASSHAFRQMNLVVDQMGWVDGKNDLLGDFVLSEEELRSSSTSISGPKPSEFSSKTMLRRPDTQLSTVDDHEVRRVLSSS